MTDIEINKRIHELMGLCQHNWNKAMYQNIWICKCGLTTDSLPDNIDFTTSWEAFGLLWEWLQKHERWEEFWLKRLENVARNRSETIMVMCQIISPPTLSRAVVEFFEVPHD